MDVPIKQEVTTNWEIAPNETISNPCHLTSINGGASNSAVEHVKLELADYDIEEYSFGCAMPVKVKQEDAAASWELGFNETILNPSRLSLVNEGASKSSMVHVKLEPADYGTEDFKIKSELLLHQEVDIKKEEPASDDDWDMSHHLQQRITSAGFEEKPLKSELSNEDFRIKSERFLHHELDIKKEEPASDDDWECFDNLHQSTGSPDAEEKPLKHEPSNEDFKIKSEPLLHHEIDIKEEEPASDEDLDMSQHLQQRITSVGFKVKPLKHEPLNEVFKIKSERLLHHEFDIKKEEPASDDDWELSDNIHQSIGSPDAEDNPIKHELSNGDFKIKSELLLHQEVDIKEEEPTSDDDLEISQHLQQRITSSGFQEKPLKGELSNEDFRIKSERLLHHELDIKKEEPASDDNWEFFDDLHQSIGSPDAEKKTIKQELSNEDFKIKSELLLHHVVDIKKEELATGNDSEMSQHSQQRITSTVGFEKKPLTQEPLYEVFKIKSQPLPHQEVVIKKDEPASDDDCKLFKKRLKRELSNDKSSAKKKSQKQIKKEARAKALKCNVCGFQGTTKNQLARHLRTHSGEKPYNCKLCDFRSATNGTLVHHMRTHSGEKPFTCKICGYGCTQKTNLNRHMAKHTGDKPFKCNVCDHRCSRKCHLEEHMRRHLGEFPFKCNVCEYRCYLKHHLKRHMKIHVGREPV